MIAFHLATAAACFGAVIHFNNAEESDAAYESPLYQKMMVLIYDADTGSDTPQRLFAEAAEMWKSNLTFARMAFQRRSKLAADIGATAESLPAYGLLLRGQPWAISHTGGWTPDGIGRFLTYQLREFRASGLHKSSSSFTASRLASYARQRPFSSVVFAFVTSARQESEVEHAARSAGVRLYLRFANESVAADVHAPCPSVIVVHGRDEVDAATAWPLFEPRYAHGEHLFGGLDVFLTERALPPLVPIGDSDEHFDAALRKSRYQITVCPRDSNSREC